MTLNNDQYDEYSMSERVERKYPYIFLENPIEALVDTIEALPEGNLPIHIPQEEYEIELDKKIANKLNCLHTLLRVMPFTIVLDYDKAYLIKNIEQLIDLEGYSWT